MSINDEVRAEMRDALRTKDQERLDTLRQVETEVSVAKSAPGFVGKVDDGLYQRVIAAYAKKMQKAQVEYEGLGDKGQAMAQKLAREVEYLARWLPQKLDEAATRALVSQAIDELGVSGPQAAGRVTGHIMKQHKDEVDGGLVSRLARELLAG